MNQIRASKARTQEIFPGSFLREKNRPFSRAVRFALQNLSSIMNEGQTTGYFLYFPDESFVCRKTLTYPNAKPTTLRIKKGMMAFTGVVAAPPKDPNTYAKYVA